MVTNSLVPSELIKMYDTLQNNIKQLVKSESNRGFWKGAFSVEDKGGNIICSKPANKICPTQYETLNKNKKQKQKQNSGGGNQNEDENQIVYDYGQNEDKISYNYGQDEDKISYNYGQDEDKISYNYGQDEDDGNKIIASLNGGSVKQMYNDERYKLKYYKYKAKYMKHKKNAH